MTNEKLIRQQAHSAYSNAIASHHPFNTDRGLEQVTRTLKQSIDRIYRTSDKYVFWNEIGSLLEKELEEHAPRCTMKDLECPLEQGIHQVQFIVNQEIERLGQVESSPIPAQHFHFASNSTNAVSTGSHSVQTSNTGQGAQINIANGQIVTQSITASEVSFLKELVEKIKHAVASEPRIDNQRDDIADQIQVIDTQLQRSEPKRTILNRTLDTIRGLVKEGIGTVAGHTIFELLDQASTTLSSSL